MIVSMACLFFFFKQKTAYEMRISDWSSDVCSSDLTQADEVETEQEDRRCRRALACFDLAMGKGDGRREIHAAEEMRHGRHGEHDRDVGGEGIGDLERDQQREAAGSHPESTLVGSAGEPVRSEEHTSELQSLMRISYAVFCLEK